MTDLTDPPREPLWTVATVTGVAAALLALLVAFGLPITDDQRVALLGFVAAIAPLMVAAWGRRLVYSPATVAQIRAALRRP